MIHLTLFLAGLNVFGWIIVGLYVVALLLLPLVWGRTTTTKYDKKFLIKFIIGLLLYLLALGVI